MLPRDYKFHFLNNLGVDLDLSSNSANETISLTLRPWKITAAGVLEYGSETTLSYSAADVADGASAEFTAQANDTDLDFGLWGTLTVETDDSAADGNVSLYVERSTDGGSTWPSDAADFNIMQDLAQGLLAELIMDGDGAGYVRSTDFVFE